MNYLNSKKWRFDEKSGISIAEDMVIDTSFSNEMQDDLFDIEDNSWWFSYRGDVIIKLMDRFYVKEKLTLDIGGGNGYTSSRAQKRGYHTGVIEPAFGACCHSRDRGIDEVNCGAVTEESVLDESVEQALLLDVLEHIEDDRGFLNLLHRKLVMGGYLLITIPAFMCLWSSEDDAAGHYRRYRLADICRLLETQGFDICYRSYFFSFLFLPILLIRVMLEKIGIIKPQDERSEEEKENLYRSQFSSRRGIMKWVLSILENIEMNIMDKEGRVPFGSSIIVISKKR